jgi:hypothetical protein
MFATEDDPFSFQKTREYSTEKISTPHSVKYYVNPNQYSRRFNTPREQRSLNDRVEAEVCFDLPSIFNISEVDVGKRKKLKLITYDKQQAGLAMMKKN